ncbi:MAG: ABC transporter permease [Defluviitaleaceae bacterium]|nr:ABC transporter permease [Defluviitaleaceae bacterium]
MIKRAFAYPYIIWMVIFIVVPLILVGYYAITVTDFYGYTTFSMANFRRFFTEQVMGNRVFVSVATRSLRLALQSTLLCFAIGYPVAYIMTRKEYSEKSVLIFLLLAPMWMNFLVRTYAWLTILERNGLINNVLMRLMNRDTPVIDILYTDAAVLLGMVYNFLPFMILPIYTSLKKMDPRLIEAAQDLGAGGFNTFLRVVFPLSIPGVVSGITMVFMPGAATFVISNLLGGRQFFLLGNVVESSFIQQGDWHFGSAVAVLMMLMMVASMVVLSFFDKGENQGRSAMI